MQSEQINELATALAKAQGAMKNAVFNRVNPHYRNQYADLASIIDAVRKPLSDNGISYMQITMIRDNGLVLETMLVHASGQWISSEYPIAIGKPQEVGSALTYAKRYSLAAITGIAADEDDDAEAASKATNGKKQLKPGESVMLANDDEVAEMRKAMKESGVTEEMVCSKYGIDKIEDMPADSVPDIFRALENRKKRMGK